MPIPSRITSTRRALVLAAALGAVLPARAAEQSFPVKPVRLIVTSGVGAGVDFFARVLSHGLTDNWKQQVIVENRPGAGGLIGAGAIAAANPDGYTIGIASTAHVVAPVLQLKPPYRPLEDFTPIALLTTIPSLLVVSGTLPVKTVADLIALAKPKPGQFNFASLGDGTAAHLQAEIFNRAAGIKVTHVPFKSVADVHTAIIAGEVHHMVFLVPSAMPVVKTGKARAIAVTSPKRIAALPDVPTIAEAGVPGAEWEALVGVVGPAGMPPAMTTRLHRDIAAVLRTADTRERFATQGSTPTPEVAPEKYGALLKREYETYRKLIGELGVKAR